MGYAEKRGRGDGAYWRGRYKLPDSTTEKRRYGTVCNPDGTPKRFTRKLDAVRAANTEETEQAAARRRAAEEQAERAAGRVTFAGWAQQWLSGQDLDDDTTGTYRSIIEHHLIGPSGDPPPGRRQFGDLHLDESIREHISDWEAAQREAGYRPKTILNRRNLLSEILADAADDPTVTLGVNPAQRRRGRGRKAVPVPAPELDEDEDDDDEDDDETGTVITSPLGAVLIAERCSLLSGRDDEFVAVILDFYCGLRWGELTGLEARYAQPGRIRVRWQLRERNGRWYRKLPKFGKRRDVDTPLFLDRLIAGHVARTDPRPCPCHGRTYLFTGLGQARGTRRAVTVADVARDAGVSQGTASTALTTPRGSRRPPWRRSPPRPPGRATPVTCRRRSGRRTGTGPGSASGCGCPPSRAGTRSAARCRDGRFLSARARGRESRCAAGGTPRGRTPAGLRSPRG